MPINLDDYSPRIKAALKKGGFACIYVASVQCGRPCRVGYAGDLVQALKGLQRSSPLQISVHDAMWLPDRSMATMIAQSVQASIDQYRGAGGWYDLAAESVAGEINLATDRLYPNAAMVPHEQLMVKWCRGKSVAPFAPR